MKLSIIIPVYNSHGVTRRQLLYFDKLNLPDDIEILIMDDGSNPPLKEIGIKVKNLKIIETNDKRPWTQGLARNLGAKLASGKYLLMTDIDHILSYKAIMASYNFDVNKMIFPRYFAILREDGTLTQDTIELMDFGLSEAQIKSKRGLYASYHGNTFCIDKDTFFKLGGYDEKRCLYGHHAPSRGGEDGAFNETWNRWAAKNGVSLSVGPNIYIFPVGRYHKNQDKNPWGLFNTLSHEQAPQPLKE